MAARTQEAPGYFVWEAPGVPVTIYLRLDVLDRLGVEVMRGFGAVPKRGAEVGGVLIGTIEASESGDSAIVRIEDFEAVECEYTRGPSYLFGETEKAEFEDAVQRRRPDSSQPAQAIGFYRSHTRDGLSLAAEDVELLDEFFPDAASIALLIKPYGTKVSEAGFFVREDGAFPVTSPLEFPFRRYELTGEEPPPRRSLLEPRQRGGIERRPRGRAFRGAAPSGDQPMVPTEIDDAEESGGAYEDHAATGLPRGPAAGAAYAVTLPSRSRFGSSIWLPLSFVFLLFGVALGMMITLARSPKGAGSDAQSFSLGLAVSKSGDNLNVKWDPQAPAVRASEQGSIEIQEGANSAKAYPLDPAQLQTGSMIYHNPSTSVKFRLVVQPRSQVSVAETIEWRP